MHKREPGYANFEIEQPPLKLVLFEAPGAERLNHLGVEVFADAAVDAQAARLEAEGMPTGVSRGEVCCFVAQNKVVTHDPQGLMWEWYQITDHVPDPAAASAEPRACCDGTCGAT